MKDSEIVILKDNGLRSFVPPNFSWDVISVTLATKITTVSELDLSRLNLAPEQEQALLDSLAKGELSVMGFITVVEATEPTRQQGLRFSVMKVVGRTPTS